jgi:hypothetical protein
MVAHPSASPRPNCRLLCALLCLSCLALGASQASALPRVQVDPPPGFLRIQAVKPGAQPGSEQQTQPNQQAPFAELEKLLEATRARLEELVSATAIMTEQRRELEAVKQQTERLATELQQANTRRTELEGSSKAAEARIAELGKAIDVAVGKTVRMDEELAAVRRQNTELEESVARAETAREDAEAKAEAGSELQGRLEAAKQAAEQSKAELAELRQELERTGKELATAEDARKQGAARASKVEQALERSDAAAERLQAELAQTKDQLGQAASAAVEAERARQVATSEADQLRGEAEVARKELAAAKSEIDRFRIANTELEEQIASLHADSESAMDSAHQNLIVMEEKIDELNAALAGAGFVETASTGGTQAKPEPGADERSTGTNLLSGMAQAAAPGPADKVSSEQEAEGVTELAARGPTLEPLSDDSAGIARFDANVRYLNSRAFEAAGSDLFSGIKAAGDGVVHVSTTPAWQNIPAAGQRSYLNSLFDLWSVAQDGSGPAIVRIVDSSGRVLLEKSGAEGDGRNAQE